MIDSTNANYIAEQLISVFSEILGDKATKIALSNESAVFRFGKGTKLFIMSGVHGNERSGPIAIIDFFSNPSNFKDLPIEFTVCPLLNTVGWDENSRYEAHINLNRCFNQKGPKFIQELMNLLRNNTPDYFVDLHEDFDKKEKDYLWIQEGAGSDFTKQIAKETGMGLLYWNENQDEWDFSSSEEFIRSLGCKNAFTAEPYSLTNFTRGVKENIDIISSVVRYVSEKSITM